LLKHKTVIGNLEGQIGTLRGPDFAATAIKNTKTFK